MRMYRIARLERLSALSALVLPAVLLAIFGVLSDVWIFIGLGVMTIGPAIFSALRLWIAFTHGPNVLSPALPEGQATKQTGIWVDDEVALEVGTKVLVCSRGRWWYAEIVGFETPDRVLVHYLGWSDVWDEPQDRSQLQFLEHPDDAIENRRRKGKETNIRIVDAIQD